MTNQETIESLKDAVIYLFKQVQPESKVRVRNNLKRNGIVIVEHIGLAIVGCKPNATKEEVNLKVVIKHHYEHYVTDIGKAFNLDNLSASRKLNEAIDSMKWLLEHGYNYDSVREIVVNKLGQTTDHVYPFISFVKAYIAINEKGA